MTPGQRVLWWLLLIFGVLLAIAAGTALWAYQRLDDNVRTTDNAAATVPAAGLSFPAVPSLSHPAHPARSDRLTLDRPAADGLFAAPREDRPPAPGGQEGS